MNREQSFVGSDDLLLVGDGLEHEFARCRKTTHELTDDFDILASTHARGIRCQNRWIDLDTSLPIQLAHGHALDHELGAQSRFDRRLVVGQKTHDSRTHVS